RSNLRQLAIGITVYADDSRDYFCWPGGIDRNWSPDWVFGGQPNTDTNDKRKWNTPSYGFHAESGSVFTHVMSLPRVRYDERNTNRYAVYRCPSTGEQGRALRVTYSLNGWMDPGERPGVGSEGVRLSIVRNPSAKVLLVNEDTKTMHNAA